MSNAQPKPRQKRGLIQLERVRVMKVPAGSVLRRPAGLKFRRSFFGRNAANLQFLERRGRHRWNLLPTRHHIRMDALALAYLPKGGIVCELEWELEPYTGSTVLSHYWTLKMTGEKDKAAAVYQQALDDGLPLPTL